MKKIFYLILFLLPIISCKKDDIDSGNKSIYRFIVDDQIYEYKYNGDQLIRIIYPTGDICNLDYADSVITYVTTNYYTVIEHGYYKINNLKNVTLKCAYKDNDTIYTRFDYEENKYLKKDSTWRGTYSNLNKYYNLYTSNHLSYDEGINYNALDKSIISQTCKDYYTNYIDWQHFGMSFFGSPSQNLPIKEIIINQRSSCNLKDGYFICMADYAEQLNIDYTYEFDSKNRIIKRKEIIKKYPSGSFIDSTVIKIEYSNE